MDISVIIPTYQPQAYLWECLESLCRQSLSADQYELIVVLNGCDEPYHSDIVDFIAHHPDVNFQFIHTDTAGVSHARNRGMASSRGEYIAFVDDDDLVSDVYLEELLKVSSCDTIGLAYPYAFNDGRMDVQLDYSITNEYERCSPRGLQKYTVAKKFFSGPCMKLFHREIIEGRQFDEDLKNGEDSLFMFLISDQFKNVAFTSRQAIYYRRYRRGSATIAPKSLTFWMNNRMRLCRLYTGVYLRNLPRYSFSFYLTRLLGAVHLIMSEWLKKDQ